MLIWDKYPNLTPAELRMLVAVTAQVMLDSDTGTAIFPTDLLQQSTASNAREIEGILAQIDPTVTGQNVQQVLEDDELSARVCYGILDQIRNYPELAEKVATAYEARRQKMTGVEVVLLAGALVVLAMRTKHIGWGSTSIDFEKAGDAVKTFVAGLVKAVV
jgi:hypothetical protein